MGVIAGKYFASGWNTCPALETVFIRHQEKFPLHLPIQELSRSYPSSVRTLPNFSRNISAKPRSYTSSHCRLLPDLMWFDFDFSFRPNNDRLRNSSWQITTSSYSNPKSAAIFPNRTASLS